MNPNKLIVVVGPTASGKSELGVNIAKHVNGEVISADSRQVYRGMDIGTGKIRGHRSGDRLLYKGAVHYGIDIASPKRQYSSGQFRKYADKVVRQIQGRSRIPILCGGSAHWIDAVVYGQNFPAVKPDRKLRADLERKTTTQLFLELRKLDPSRAAAIDQYNPRRLIRALEIVLSTGKAVPKLKQNPRYDVLWLGLKPEQDTLYKKIDRRLMQRLKAGMIDEIELLHRQGLAWKRLESFGLEYKYGALYLQNKLTYGEMTELMSRSIKQYSKRQLTWWKRNPGITWIRTLPEAHTLAARFLKAG